MTIRRTKLNLRIVYPPSRVRFWSVQTVRRNRGPANLGAPHFLTSNFFCFFWTFFLHSYPPLHPKEGTAEQRKVYSKAKARPSAQHFDRVGYPFGNPALPPELIGEAFHVPSVP